MTSGEIWAVIALLALGGWAWSNFTLQRALVPVANAFNILEKLSDRMDDRIRETVERIANRRGSVPAPAVVAPKPSRNPDLEAINQVLGGNLIEPLGEQPEAGMDIVE